MTKVVFGMTMSLDGFVADRDGSVARLYPDMDALHATEALQAAVRTTGAVLMGRRTFAMGDPDEFADSYEFQVPLFVVTHAAPARLPLQNEKLTFTFVTDGVASAVRQARAAAGGKDVTVVGGPNLFRQLLRAGLVDEIELSLRPLLLGGGLRLFEDPGPAPIALEVLQVTPGPLTTDIRYRVIGD
jgi:dihydrofolate reductase